MKAAKRKPAAEVERLARGENPMKTLTLTVEEKPKKESRSPHMDCDCGGKCPVCIAHEKMVKLAEEEFLKNFFRGTLQR